MNKLTRRLALTLTVPAAAFVRETPNEEQAGKRVVVVVLPATSRT
jgi:hypothetical protein